jgi:hypothetical protein
MKPLVALRFATDGVARQQPIAPVGSLPDNGPRAGRVHGDTEQSFSAAQRIYRATGRIGVPARPAGVVALGAIFIFWGVRAATRSEAKTARMATMIRAGSLALVGIFILAVPFVPARHASQLFVLAGGVLVLRGALAAAISVARH